MQEHQQQQTGWNKTDEVVFLSNNNYSKMLLSIRGDPFWNCFLEKFEKQFSKEILLNHKIDYYKYYKFCGRAMGIDKIRARKIMFKLKNKGYLKLNCNGFYFVGGKK